MKLTNIAADVLNDAVCYLDQISPAQYQAEVDLLSHVSVGMHTRHFIEFFQCLLEQATSPGGIIDYSQRIRDANIERDPVYASRCIRDIQTTLLGQLSEAKSFMLECSEHLPGEEKLMVQSNLERELMYNIEHTIHHLAIIKIGLRLTCPDISLPEHFGVAPSTILHRKEKACAQ